MGDYLRPYRLEEVIRLIQVAGLGDALNPGNQALENLLGQPRSATAPATDWVSLAAEHPEFFRANQNVDAIANHSLTLVARFYQDADPARPPLPWNQVTTLNDMAVELHECQARACEQLRAEQQREFEYKKDRQVIMIAVITSAISALATVVAAVIGILGTR